jgi:23S rRNA (uridine2552-2'-O)-methyltransferase
MPRYHHRDRFHRRAEILGLRSRAAFKLEELLARFKLLSEGGRVIDLGCAPGGWLSILARTVGSRGRIVGIDLAPCAGTASNVITLAGDVGAPEIRRKMAEALGSAADLITSDLAPKLSGIAEQDQARSRELVETALDLARDFLKPGGAMVVKIFMGPDFELMRAKFAHGFVRIDVARTQATRPGSSELFIVARGFRNSLTLLGGCSIGK